MDQKDFPKSQSTDYCIVIQSSAMLENMINYGKEVIGIDSVYKLTRNRNPLWAVTAIDSKSNMGVLCGLILGGSSTTEVLQLGIQQLLDKVVSTELKKYKR